MVKYLQIISFSITIAIHTNAQDTLSLWPIQGQKAGDGILYKPTDYIGTEKNYGDLFITATEGTPVLAPKDGIINRCNYTYHTSLITSTGFNDSNPNTTNIVEFDRQQRKLVASENSINAQFISISIGISCGHGEKYYISGLRPVTFFKTGYKIKAGDIIGYVGFCYKQIPQPCIWLCRSINTRVADPMSPFGLKTSFIPFKPAPTKSEIPISELVADFNVFKQALEEGHPGLYDYTSRANMDTTFNRVRRKINRPISSSKFLELLRPILDSLRDSHTKLYNVSGQSDNYSKREVIELPVFFGFQNDSLMIYRTLPKYKDLLWKHIVKINNDSAASLIHSVNVFGGGEGNIHVALEYSRLRLFSIYYKYQFHYKEGDSVILTFSDNTKACLTYQVIKDTKEFIPRKVTKTNANENNFEFRPIDKKTAYLQIKSFGFGGTDVDSLCSAMKDLSRSVYQNLIIDVRDNPGGNDSYSLLFGMLAEQPFRTKVACMVKSNGRYAFLKNAPSYYGVDTVTLFPNYQKIEGKEGFYNIPKGLTNPNDSIHFGGKVYLLINENSFSAATLLAALMHKYKRGTIIGRETGSCFYQMNANKFVTVRLNNSMLELTIPLIKEIFDTEIDKSIPWGRGVMPDHQIRWTYNEFFNVEDPILNYTLSLIENQ